MSDIAHEELMYLLFATLPGDLKISAAAQEKMLTAWSKRYCEEDKQQALVVVQKSMMSFFHEASACAQDWLLGHVKKQSIQLSTPELIKCISESKAPLKHTLDFAQCLTFDDQNDLNIFKEYILDQCLFITSDEASEVASALGKMKDAPNKISQQDILNSINNSNFYDVVKHVDQSIIPPLYLFERKMSCSWHVRDRLLRPDDAFVLDAVKQFLKSQASIEGDEIAEHLGGLVRRSPNLYQEMLKLFMASPHQDVLLASNPWERIDFDNDLKNCLTNISAFIEHANTSNENIEIMLKRFVSNMFYNWFSCDMTCAFEWMNNNPQVSSIFKNKNFFSDNVFLYELDRNRNRTQKNKTSISNTKNIKDTQISPFVIDVARVINDPKLLKIGAKLSLPVLSAQATKNWADSNSNQLEIWNSLVTKKSIQSHMPKKRTVHVKRKM